MAIVAVCGGVAIYERGLNFTFACETWDLELYEHGKKVCTSSRALSPFGIIMDALMNCPQADAT